MDYVYLGHCIVLLSLNTISKNIIKGHHAKNIVLLFSRVPLHVMRRSVFQLLSRVTKTRSCCFLYGSNTSLVQVQAIRVLAYIQYIELIPKHLESPGLITEHTSVGGSLHTPCVFKPIKSGRARNLVVCGCDENRVNFFMPLVCLGR